MSGFGCRTHKSAGVASIFLAVLICGVQASAQQPTQEQAAAQQLELEIQVEELRAALTPAAKAENAFAWAMDEIMLGNKLRKLGEFDDGAVRLNQAAQAYQAAVEALPCDKFITLCGGVKVSLEEVAALAKQRGK